MPFKFEKLLVWQKSVVLSKEVHLLTKKKFPKDELFILTSQIKRAADSVSLNIVEGSTGQSNAEFKKFITYSLRSCMEVVGCLYLAQSREYITKEDFDAVSKKCEELLVMLNALKNSMK